MHIFYIAIWYKKMHICFPVWVFYIGSSRLKLFAIQALHEANVARVLQLQTELKIAREAAAVTGKAVAKEKAWWSICGVPNRYI